MHSYSHIGDHIFHRHVEFAMTFCGVLMNKQTTEEDNRERHPRLKILLLSSLLFPSPLEDS